MVNQSCFLQPDWPAPARVQALSSTRWGGFSSGPYQSLNLGDQVGDDPKVVATNRRWLQQQAELTAEPQWLRQVHGANLLCLPEDAPVPADASYTREAGVVLAVLSADCLPLLLCNRQGTEIAAVHCGWRSVAAGLIPKTVAHMNSAATDILAWLGPAIGPQHFQVGAEVRDAMLVRDPVHQSAFVPDGRRWLADLPLLVRQELALVGATACYNSERCTYSEPQTFFSYRRDGTTGRQASLIWLHTP